MQASPVRTQMIRDSVFYRRDQQSKEIEPPLLQTDTEDRVENVNILIYQVLKQIYNKTKVSQNPIFNFPLEYPLEGFLWKPELGALPLYTSFSQH